MKKILSLLLAVCMLFLLCSCSGGSKKVEGAGYKSPEDAALAYAKALKSCNVGSILSTFAIETYVENFSLEKHFEHYKTYVFGGTALPATNDYTKDLAVINRQNSIVSSLSSIYVFAGTSEEMKPSYIAQDAQEAQPYVDLFSDDSWMTYAKQMTIGKTLRMEDFPESQDVAEAMERARSERCEVWNYDDWKPMAVEVTIDGADYYLCVDTVCYNGKWYNETPRGTISALIDGSNNYGLAPR